MLDREASSTEQFHFDKIKINKQNEIVRFARGIFNSKPYNSYIPNKNMETITIPKEQFEKMKAELERLRKEKEEIDFDIERQVKEGLEDLKKGRIIRLV